MTVETREQAIDRLLATDALRDLATRYARAIDRRDMVLLRSVYFEDAVDEHGTAYSGPIEGFVAAFPKLMANFELTNHYICNTSYRIDGDRANGELYFIAYHRTSDPHSKHLVVTGRYLDRYDRRGGEWRISHRRLVWDAVLNIDVTDEDTALLGSLGAISGFEDDMSYEALPLMGRGR